MGQQNNRPTVVETRHHLVWIQCGSCVHRKTNYSYQQTLLCKCTQQTCKGYMWKCWYQLPRADEWQNSMNIWINKQDKNLYSVDLSLPLSLSRCSFFSSFSPPNIQPFVFPSVFCFHELMNNLQIWTVCIHLAFTFSSFIHKLVIRKC